MDDIGSSQLHATINSVLLEQDYVKFTEIQSKVIPLICSDSTSVLALAPTGSGKTIAYVAPLLNALIEDPSRKFVIVLPTRDLALQVHTVVKTYCATLGFTSAVFVGGSSVYKDYHNLKRKLNFIIGTPGRLIFHLQSLKKLAADTLVLDEVDRLLDIGFKKEYDLLLSVHSHSRKIFFSATMPKQLKDLVAGSSGTKLQLVDATKVGHKKDSIVEEFINVQSNSQKFPMLIQKLKTVSSTVVFVNSRKTAKSLSKRIVESGFKSVVYSSDRSVNQRKRILEDFSSARTDVIVATDIAARGLDFKNLNLVVNYQVPFVPSDYVHRIGRTGRANCSGKTVMFISKDQFKYAKNIDTFKTTNQQILEPRPFFKPFNKGSRSSSKYKKK